MSASVTPDAESLLQAIAAAAPGLWFPLRHAEETGVPRDALNEPLWLLRQAGLVEVGDWVKGLGQGLRLSEHGEQAVTASTPLAVHPTAPPPTPSGGPTELVRGDEVRSAVLDPPPAIVAPSLLYANLAWFAVGCVLAWHGGVGLEFLKGDSHPAALETMMNVGAVTSAAVWRGDWWRLATCCFVHIGLFHLLCNMLMLGLMGPFAEGLWGRGRFALIYAVAGVAGSAVAVAVHPLAESGAVVILAGASGALWGMLLGIVVWVVRARRHLPPEMVREWLRKLVFVVLLNVAVSFAPGISAEAHFGGGLAGAAVAWSVATGHRRPRLWAVGGVSLALLVPFLLLVGQMNWSKDWQTVKTRERIRQQVEELRRTLENTADRDLFRAAVGKDWAALGPVAVGKVHERFRAAIPDRIAAQSNGPASLRKAAEHLRETAIHAATRLPTNNPAAAPYRDYFAAAAHLAAAIRDELDRNGRKDTPEVDAAWQAYRALAERIGPWE